MLGTLLRLQLGKQSAGNTLHCFAMMFRHWLTWGQHSTTTSHQLKHLSALPNYLCHLIVSEIAMFLVFHWLSYDL